MLYRPFLTPTYLFSLLTLFLCLQITFQIHVHKPNREQIALNRNLRGAQAAGVVFGDYKLEKKWTDSDNVYHYTASYGTGSEQWGNSVIIKNIHLTVAFHDKNTVRVKILDNDNKRWEIPEAYPFVDTHSENLISAEDANCEVHVQEQPFNFYVSRKDTGDILYDMRDQNFAYSNYYIEFATKLPSKYIYGIGERYFRFLLQPGVYTIWGRDDPMILEDKTGGGNTYSHHPVALVRDKSKNYFLTYMKNSNAMDVVLSDSDVLTYKMVGGIVDLMFFVGDQSPDTAINNYHRFLGKWTMMPFWSMGFHQSKWGYVTADIMEGIVSNYDSHDVPLDVIWSDIDYMIDKEDFTIDTSRYPPEKMKNMFKKYKKHWVPIIDAGIRINFPRGPGAQKGLERNVFLKNHRGDDLVGSVWPGLTYFVDFFHKDAEQYWCDMLEEAYKTIPFHGIWLDMNEVANFVDGENQRWDLNEYDRIPYNPGKHPLKRKTISLDAVHEGGIMEYDAHSLFAIQENAATYKFLKTKSKLPFILTRSSSVGTGKYSAHWTGDNGAHWEYLQISIPGNFNFQMFGQPFVGADICGFMDDTNAELCARWVQVGAFYPFARNHHEDRTRNQEPWAIAETNRGGVTVLETNRVALKFRYSILKWYYSLFIATKGIGSVFRPMSWEFPAEEELLDDDYNGWEFMLGKGMLVTPKVQPGEPNVNAYFPKATWYEFATGKRIITAVDRNRVLKIDTPFNTPAPVFLRAGHIVHQQDVSKVLVTEELNDEFNLIIALRKEDDGDDFVAEGSIMGIKTFDDDNVNDRCMEDNCLIDMKLTLGKSFEDDGIFTLEFKGQEKATKAPLDDLKIKSIKIYGMPIKFIAEDEKKMAYVSTVKISGFDGDASQPEIVKTQKVKSGIIDFAFADGFRIQSGDRLQFNLIV